MSNMQYCGGSLAAPWPWLMPHGLKPKNKYNTE